MVFDSVSPPSITQVNVLIPVKQLNAGIEPHGQVPAAGAVVEGLVAQGNIRDAARVGKKGLVAGGGVVGAGRVAPERFEASSGIVIADDVETERVVTKGGIGAPLGVP